MVTFNQIPSGIRTPGIFTEFDGSGALQGTPAKPHTALLIGLRASTGTVAEKVPTQIIGTLDGDGFFGVGSPLAEMSRAFKAANPRTKLIAIGLNEVGAGVVASGKIEFGGTATKAGTVSAYIGGRLVRAAVAVGDDGADVALALAAAIDADARLPVGADVGGGGAEDECIITAKLKGPHGNDIALELNREQDEALPAGITATITPMASGATAATVADAIGVFGDVQFDTIATMFNDSTNLGLLETELARRWGPMVSLEGHAFAGITGNASAAIAATTSRNSPHVTIMPTLSSPTPPWLMAAVVAAADAGESDPGRPRHTLPLVGIVAPKTGLAPIRETRDLLLHSGLSTYKVDAGGNVIIERLITSYRKNALNVDDPTYLDITTMRTLAYLRWSWNLRIAVKYPRHKLANDGTNFAPGSKVVTPSVMRGEALSWFREMEFATHVEGFEQFKRDLVVMRSPSDPNRLDLVLNPDLVNQLGVVATQIGFRL